MFVRINLKIATLLISILFILYSCLGSKNSVDKSYKMNTENHYKTLKIKITKEAGIAKSGLADSLTVTQKALVKNDKILIKNKYPSPF